MGDGMGYVFKLNRTKMRKGALQKEIKQDLINVRNGVYRLTPILNKILRLIGCDRCFGKGYGTKTEFASSGRGDFYRDKTKPKTWRLNPIVYCDCQRGKQIEKLFKQR